MAQLADELRVIAATSLYFSTDPHDRARFEQIRVVAAELQALVDRRDPSEILRIFADDLISAILLAGADAVIFDAEGRILLTDRADGRGWCVPGGLVEVGAVGLGGGGARGVRGGRAHRPGRRTPRRLRQPEGVTARPGAHVFHHVHRCEILSGCTCHDARGAGFRWFGASEIDGLIFNSIHATIVRDAFHGSKHTLFQLVLCCAARNWRNVPRVPLLLLDLDNTLVDIVGAFRLWAKDFLPMIGAPDSDLEWLMKLDGDGFTPRDEVAAAMRARYLLDAPVEDIVAELRMGVVEHTRLDPLIACALQIAHRAGWMPVIVTNGTLRQQEAKMRRVGLERYVAGWVISEEAGVRKPDPRIFNWPPAGPGTGSTAPG